MFPCPGLACAERERLETSLGGFVGDGAGQRDLVDVEQRQNRHRAAVSQRVVGPRRRSRPRSLRRGRNAGARAGPWRPGDSRSRTGGRGRRRRRGRARVRHVGRRACVRSGLIRRRRRFARPCVRCLGRGRGLCGDHRVGVVVVGSRTPADHEPRSAGQRDHRSHADGDPENRASTNLFVTLILVHAHHLRSRIEGRWIRAPRQSSPNVPPNRALNIHAASSAVYRARSTGAARDPCTSRPPTREFGGAAVRTTGRRARRARP